MTGHVEAEEEEEDNTKMNWADHLDFLFAISNKINIEELETKLHRFFLG